MTSLRRSRQRACQYIVEQAKKLNWDLECKPDKKMHDVEHISLNKIMNLREDLSDPSQERVAVLKKLSSHKRDNNT